MPWNPKQRTDKTGYNANNPPPDWETAERKMNDLTGSISRIEIDLEEREVESFPNEAEYEDWRKRALVALVHLKAEARFLEGWFALQKKKDIGQVITAGVAVLTKDVLAETSGLRYPPTSLEEAQNLLETLTKLRDRIGSEYARLLGLAKDTILTKRETIEKLNPLKILTETIEDERRSAKGYIAANYPDAVADTVETLPVHAQKILELAQTSATALAEERSGISGPDNAPSDPDEARRRLAALRIFRSRVSQELQLVAELWREHPYTAGTLKAVNRPLVALQNSINDEIWYLNGFIEEFQHQVKVKEREAQKEREEANAAKKAADAIRQDDLLRASQHIRKRAQELAAEIGSSYTALYTAERPPTDMEEAQQRQALASETKLRLQAAFSEITDAWCQHPLRRKDLPGVKKPLMDMLVTAEREISIAKKFIAAQAQLSRTARPSWRSVCVAALTRAACEGFKLTDEERTVIQEIIADLGGKS